MERFLSEAELGSGGREESFRLKLNTHSKEDEKVAHLGQELKEKEKTNTYLKLINIVYMTSSG